MRKMQSAWILVLIISSTLSGCAGSSGANNDTVAIDGSTSMEKVIGYLSEVYMEENPHITVTYNPTGSGAGIQAVRQGRCDIGLSSRDLKEEEAEGLHAAVVAIDGIAVIVNPQNPVSDLSLDQVEDMFEGEITNWKEVGGNDGPIVLIGREASSGTRDGFESATDTEDECNYTQELTSNGDVVQTVASNPNAIGYASLESVKDTVSMLKIEGVAPTIESIQTGDYQIQRKFILITKAESPLSSAAQGFLNFATSGAADDLIARAGAVPVKR